jgi:hypothetical protein
MLNSIIWTIPKYFSLEPIVFWIHGIKGGLILEKFHIGSNLPNKVPNHSPESYPPTDLALSLEIRAKK